MQVGPTDCEFEAVKIDKFSRYVGLCAVPISTKSLETGRCVRQLSGFSFYCSQFASNGFGVNLKMEAMVGARRYGF